MEKGNKSNRGYKTEESEKENTSPRNTRDKNKQLRNRLQHQPVADNWNSGGWKYTHKMKYNPDGIWSGKKKAWFRSAQYEADKKMKDSDPRAWKKMKTKRLQDQIKELDS